MVFNGTFVDEEIILELVKQSEEKYGFDEELKKIHTDSLKKRELLSKQSDVQQKDDKQSITVKEEVKKYHKYHKS